MLSHIILKRFLKSQRFRKSAIILRIKIRSIPMSAIMGKSYSLYGDESTTTSYYTTIRNVIDTLLLTYPDEKKLLFLIQKASKNKGILKKLFFPKNGKINNVLFTNVLTQSLNQYTTAVEGHLKKISLFKRFDDILGTQEYQYHLYMIEIELVNRIYKKSFKNSSTQMAFLPHCLRDFRLKCLSDSDDIEHVCKACTKECYLNLGSKILKKYNIKSYISVTIDQDKLFKSLKDKYKSIGMLGIACVPELVRGMRLCIHLNIPPIGIPLDANRCSRWMGQAQESSFNLYELEELVS